MPDDEQEEEYLETPSKEAAAAFRAQFEEYVASDKLKDLTGNVDIHVAGAEGDLAGAYHDRAMEKLGAAMAPLAEVVKFTGGPDGDAVLGGPGDQGRGHPRCWGRR